MCGAWAAGCATAAADVSLQAENVKSEEGLATLTWTLGDETEEAPHLERQFELQQSERPDFSEAQIRYRGPDRITVISGLREGRHFFRVRQSTEGDWSEPVIVDVKYPGMRLVVWLMGLGAVAFAGTVGAVIHGHLSNGAANG